MIVITIILILAGIAATRYEKSVLRAREATLKQDLFIMRNAIAAIYARQGSRTQPSLSDDLVQSKYMSGIPVDPITHQKKLGDGIRSCPA